MEKPVGYMLPTGGEGSTLVICPECKSGKAWAEPLDLTPIYRGNIYPYKQRCCVCDKLLVVGQSPAWPELFF